jgi:riboflavin synthase
MFTGMVTAVGAVRRARALPGGGLDLEIAAPYRGLALGESIAVNGACLSVAGRGRGWFRVHAVPSTLERTRLATLVRGDRVNLERALRAGDRLGGHLVQGHVDGLARVAGRRERGDSLVLRLAVPRAVAGVSVPLGSITVDGVSLTVNRVRSPGIIEVSLIPLTRRRTTLGALRAGDRVHVEGDLIGKYLRALTRRRRTSRRAH